jgi:hypothetical protein
LFLEQRQLKSFPSLLAKVAHIPFQVSEYFECLFLAGNAHQPKCVTEIKSNNAACKLTQVEHKMTERTECICTIIPILSQRTSVDHSPAAKVQTRFDFRSVHAPINRPTAVGIFANFQHGPYFDKEMSEEPNRSTRGVR